MLRRENNQQTDSADKIESQKGQHTLVKKTKQRVTANKKKKQTKKNWKKSLEVKKGELETFDIIECNTATIP